MLVVLAASSESTCLEANACMFTFTTPVATVTSLTSAFNPASNNIEVIAEGIDFPAGNMNAVSLFINGWKQVTKSVESGTSMVFTIHNAQQDADATIRMSTALVFEDGYPSGFDLLPQLTPFQISFASITPNSNSSAGGTLVQVRAPGISPQTKGLNLFDVTQNKTICQQASYLEQDIFTCLTIPGEIPSTDEIKM